ncbi:hypothetical protein CN692_13300 [Bacillus sp. AFS002410]|nr:hypothetical protein [Bacillus sp. AFS002410]PEJ57384.1 hypothetical protein CN692_13300 [Bacillus sp. AFS002410]
MASNLTNYAQAKLLDHVLGTTAFTKPTTIYVSLHTADPTETGSTAAEIVGNGYVRQAITFAAGTNAAGIATALSNGADVLFPAATAS